MKFGTQAFAIRKWWQHRYEQWRDIREPVLVLGPDACSTLTSTNYFVQAIDTGRYFFTADVITPDLEATEDAVLVKLYNHLKQVIMLHYHMLRNQSRMKLM